MWRLRLLLTRLPTRRDTGCDLLSCPFSVRLRRMRYFLSFPCLFASKDWIEMFFARSHVGKRPGRMIKNRETGQGSDEFLRVGMLGSAENLRRGAAFDDFAGVENGDAM